TRSVLLVVHTGRSGNVAHAQRLAKGLQAVGFTVQVLPDEASRVDIAEAQTGGGNGAELVIALGGDGPLLRAAQLAYPAGVPLLGVNAGRVGFLAEAELTHLDDVVAAVAARDYDIEERLVIETSITDGELVLARDWALNEISVEKAANARM